jgi:hypothetical protein
VKATRVMKARKVSRCALCGAQIRVNEQIGKTPRGWAHCACVLLAVDGSLWDAQTPRPTERTTP